jgi:uncharacterized membrane protein
MLKISSHQKDRNDMMYGPRILCYMGIAFVIFAVAAYVASESLLDALLQTAMFAVCLQVGYALVVIYRIIQRMNTRIAMLRACSSSYSQDKTVPDQE